jgi:hypothetical protein
MKLAFISATSLLLIVSVSANEVGPPPITAETLIGVWEAAPVLHGLVYRLEINKTGPSYLALVYGSENLVYRLTSSKVRDGRVNLHFQCLSDRRQGREFRVHGGPEMNELWISGKGDASEKGGIFEGTLRMKDSVYDDDFTTSPITFAKPPWTRDLTTQSKKSEALIKAVKSRR